MTNDMLFKPSKLGMLLSYLVIYFIGASIIMMPIIGFYAAKYDLTYIELLNYMGGLIDGEQYKVAAAAVNAYTMFIAYGLCAIVISFYGRNYLKEDILKIKENPKKAIIMIVILTISFYAISWVIDYLVTIATLGSTSDNQNQIIDMILDGSAFASFMAVVVFAPLVEELVYRKLIFEWTKKYSLVLSYIVSTVIFGLIHMTSTTNVEPYVWVLLSVSYLSSGALLCAVYHFSKENVVISTIVHMFNNLVAFIAILML